MRRIAWRPRAPQSVLDDGEIVELEPDPPLEASGPRLRTWDQVEYAPAPDPGSTAGIWEALRHS